MVEDRSMHWPRFGKILCGTMTDRERLGLPDRFVKDRVSLTISSDLEIVRRRERSVLVENLTDVTQSLSSRIAAGTMLALVGDPRIATFSPDMIDIKGGCVAIGLEPADVANVLRRYDQLGLDEAWIAKECPRHPVTLSDYRIARFPVTNTEYRDFLVDTGYHELPDSWSFRRFPIERSNHPVYTLTAEACEAYAAWLSVRTGRHFRLPNEAEWEFAAAGIDGREFPWGEGFDTARANTCESGIFSTTSVGLFVEGAAACGALDMAGNVEEYTADVYRPYPGGKLIDDHLSQLNDSYRVARGGSFARFRDLARNRRRHGHNPRSSTYAMGFRLAETP